MDEYWVELDNECTYEEGINETVDQTMEMEVDQNAPFLQGPSAGPGMLGDGDESSTDGENQKSEDDANGSSSDEDADDSDSDDDDDDDGDEKGRGGQKGRGDQRKKVPQKEEPCEDTGLSKNVSDGKRGPFILKPIHLFNSSNL